MTSLGDRPNSAVVVVDVQNGVVAGAHRRDAVVATIGRLVDKARAAGVPVLWVQDVGEDRAPGTDPWQIVPELLPADGEPRIGKSYGDSFEDTDLEAVLARLKVGRMFVAGAQTDACIRSTLHGAFVRGYDTVLVADAHTTEDLTQWGAPSPEAVIRHTNLYWQHTSAPGRIAAVIATDDIEFPS
ncbi:isochorismatase family protein [Nocardia terpenica]|uniref:isochorismatase family protein n=1 Tax=Nocardia terpenica TaxID=455432 RepID=UPI001893C317|nr:isochorismatase family protein [Nocardia terpenica]MBF6064072.1 isochorismatase family protein [Nocardia terpenica]MBF6107692.1 isochorismatase family protein [Nocardia terpenica]MBF6114760.1 isochorismatase family protein [Nocardia terpenica]MBF6121253.1 isochorismatase family protein [Nocardia terpenica]MBF6153205.1 isochorismatase family protein [Nocardia terpenica]